MASYALQTPPLVAHAKPPGPTGGLVCIHSYKALQYIVDHTIIMKKLELLGFDQSAVTWGLKLTIFKVQSLVH